MNQFNAIKHAGLVKRYGIPVAITGAVIGIAGVALAAMGSRLVMNGRVVSTNVRSIGGEPYVPLSDVARGLGMTVQRRNGGYEIVKAGGANPIQGVTQGKVGDVLFDGRWRFQVLSVQTTDSYAMKTSGEPYDPKGANYNMSTRVMSAGPNNELVVIHCRITNGQNTKETLWTAISDDTLHTAITDTDGSSYPPIDYDYEGGPTQTRALIPGARMEFPVIFAVPQGTHLKDLVFTLHNNHSGQSANDVRVSLTGAG